MKPIASKPMLTRVLILAFTCLAAGSCSVSVRPPQILPCPGIPAGVPAPPVSGGCQNEELTSYDELLLLVPHPDDEVLGFAGLASEFIRLKKPVSIVIVTDGDGYCDACAFWKNIGRTEIMSEWDPCSEADLAQFAAIRREESVRAQEILGGPAPTFWNYPDTGIQAAWEAIDSGRDVDVPLRRPDCAQEGAFGEGGGMALSPRALLDQLTAAISRTSPRALIGTTHPLDGHVDHSGLGNLVRKVNTDLRDDGDPETAPRSVVFAVIHANSYHDGRHYDCWHPCPDAVDCQCLDPEKLACYRADAARMESVRGFRYRPEWPGVLPDDAPYVASIPHAAAVSLCLPPALFRGEAAAKLLAVRVFASQQGFLARDGTIPIGLGGWIDCFGYQLSFVRSSEAFVLEHDE
jgi:LmbE family N-acetylglucosaminyl deacetylase